MLSTVYLEAHGKPQSLYTLKWHLRAAGVEIRSTWHDEAAAEGNVPGWHLQSMRVARLRSCDALVLVQGDAEDIRPELAIILGLALGSGLQVIWIGERLPLLNQFPTLKRFASIEDFASEMNGLSHSKLAA